MLRLRSLRSERKVRSDCSIRLIGLELRLKTLELGDNIVEGGLWELRQGALDDGSYRVKLSTKTVEEAKDLHGFIHWLADGTERVTDRLELSNIDSKGFAFVS